MISGKEAHVELPWLGLALFGWSEGNGLVLPVVGYLKTKRRFCQNLINPKKRNDRKLSDFASWYFQNISIKIPSLPKNTKNSADNYSFWKNFHLIPPPNSLTHQKKFCFKFKILKITINLVWKNKKNLLLIIVFWKFIHQNPPPSTQKKFFY